MPRLPRTSSGKVVAALERLGFTRMRTKGSHLVMQRADSAGKRQVCVVPLHDDIAVGTLRSVLRQAGVDPDEFIRVL
ncbi:MAG TPA: type II toxin-antitoxin system HicA family toxin [Geminicoccus sp.]|nr:type II toxin-antitoxin system HicA family toxin [Geminicoccus sp.]